MNLNKYFLITMLAFILLPLQVSSAAETPVTRTIIVHGSGSFSAPADQATIDIGIEITNADAQIAEQKNSRIAEAIQNQLLESGINKDKITTTRYTFYPIYNNTTGRSDKVIGYNVNNTISVTIDDLKNVGNVIGSSIQLGANKINSINFSIKATDDMEKKALQAAVKDAKTKALVIAAALGKQVVNVVNVSENGTSIANHRIANYGLKSASLDMAPTPIQAGNVEINANVEITFEIN